MEFTLARKRYGELASSGIFSSSKSQPGQNCHGLIIISEFISSARVMRGALTLNPWRIDEVKEALKHALEMTPTEQADRFRRNLEFSTRLTTSNWAKHVLHDLKAVEKSSDPNASYALGFGMKYKVMNLKAGFQPLDVKAVSTNYRNARYRLIIVDWGGTLVANTYKDKLQAYAIATGHAQRDTLNQELLQLLDVLSEDSKNVFFVISGKEMHAVQETFGHLKRLGLAAEHGFYFRWPSNSVKEESRWQAITDTVDNSWKEPAKLVMDIFVQRTHGTYIEQKGNALIWQFSDADPEFGFMQSKELEDHLHTIMAPYSVDVIRGGGVSDGYIEVRPTSSSKGAFLEHALGLMKLANNDPDFILTIGDDNSDEPMFERVANLLKEKHLSAAYGVTVGKKPTSAGSYIDDPTAVIELLTTLSKCSQRERRYFSAVDLPSHALSDITGFAQQLKLEQVNQVSDANDHLHSCSIFGTPLVAY